MEWADLNGSGSVRRHAARLDAERGAIVDSFGSVRRLRGKASGAVGQASSRQSMADHIGLPVGIACDLGRAEREQDGQQRDRKGDDIHQHFHGTLPQPAHIRATRG